MRSSLCVCLVLIAAGALQGEAQPVPRVRTVALQPFQMTGVRGETAPIQPVRMEFPAFLMTGMRDSIAAPAPVRMQLNSFIMTGVSGSAAAPAPVQINLNQFQMTGLR